MKAAEIKETFIHLLISALVISLFLGIGYLYFLYQMAGYDAFFACNPRTGIGRIQWLLGIRPVDTYCTG
jgi:hypothetical protein